MDETERIPYGLLDVDGHTLLHSSVERLRQAGFTKIIIVSGQKSKVVSNLAETLGVQLLYDALFADFGSMFALRRLAPLLTSYPFVLVESGIFFESRLALLARTMQPANGVVVSQSVNRSGGIGVEAANNRLLTLAHYNSGSPALGTDTALSSGIYKISRAMYAEMLAFAAQQVYTKPFLDYIDCINGITPAVDIRLVSATHLLWTQVRSRAEMRWALNNLQPRTTRQEDQCARMQPADLPY